MSVAPDIASLLSGVGAGPAAGASYGGGQQPEVGELLRTAIDAIKQAFEIDPDEQDKAKYADLIAKLQACLGEGQAMVDKAMGDPNVAKLMRKMG